MEFMRTKDCFIDGEPCILIEGPRRGDADFYGRWLIAAARANALWKKALEDCDFAKQVDRLTIAYEPDFSLGATALLSRLADDLTSVIIRLDAEEVELAEELVVMASMGFFILTGARYQMVIPNQLNLKTVKAAALRFAQTEDEEYDLHPEYLVTVISREVAMAWQTRLRDMDDCHRNADRALLLEETRD
jgi:hypothetical protein